MFLKVHCPERVSYANLFQYLGPCHSLLLFLIVIELRSCCNWDIEFSFWFALWQMCLFLKGGLERDELCIEEAFSPGSCVM